MDWVGFGNLAMSYIKKYRYVILILLAGILLMLLPEDSSAKPSETIKEVQQELSLQDSLAEILSQIDGAGKTKVLLTMSAGEQTVYQTDEDISTSDSTNDIRSETVILSDGSRGETGLVQQVIPPVYRGAIILCQGAASPAVRLSIVEAVADVTGLTSDNITVLKMK